jgi:beta-aspartyl-peptidase (threonine type)
VEAAVRALEDDPTFNAGTGATLTAAGDAELDASIMDGETLRCGAVAVVTDVLNPVSLARAVMERSPHVLLAGPGASVRAAGASGRWAPWRATRAPTSPRPPPRAGRP